MLVTGCGACVVEIFQTLDLANIGDLHALTLFRCHEFRLWPSPYILLCRLVFICIIYVNIVKYTSEGVIFLSIRSNLKNVLGILVSYISLYPGSMLWRKALLIG